MQGKHDFVSYPSSFSLESFACLSCICKIFASIWFSSNSNSWLVLSCLQLLIWLFILNWCPDEFLRMMKSYLRIICSFNRIWFFKSCTMSPMLLASFLIGLYGLFSLFPKDCSIVFILLSTFENVLPLYWSNCFFVKVLSRRY